MPRRLGFWILRWACAILAFNLGVALVRMVCEPLSQPSGWERLLHAGMAWAILGGWGARYLLTRWRGSDPLEFLDTLEHELTHAAIGTLTFAPPVSLKATLRDGGEVELRRTNPLAVLAPYFMPLYAGLWSLLTLVLRQDALPWGRVTVGLLLGSFAYRLTREFHWGQTDFREFGLLFSLTFIAALLPVSLSEILDVARVWHLPWSEKIWPLSLEQGRWIWKAVSAGFSNSR